MSDEPAGFRARPASSEPARPKVDTVALIVDDLTELAEDARAIVTKGRQHFLSETGRLERHAADGIMTQELCERLPQQFKTDHPDIQWSEIRGIRNRIGHNYRATDHRIVWVTLMESLPALVDGLK